ncbi:uncharacterized protein DUF2795 [Cupriavidus gilardii J11]|uniref:Uncharacterized protein DUF2795 n=1 Tax=Cupriavidus gilardii J11 TaxID=936133 RepID=A0A562BPP5_9BURK|nr:DUF2795 domain-containing protein [Cupriavidus gilardii]TWG87258.1 uncharacterized protein DUF2795 [Cupriavidus gilardii J11]
MTSKQSEQGKKDSGREQERGAGGGEEPSPIDVQKSLKGLDFPASKEDIVSRARDGGASDDILSELEQLPEREYQTPADISKELGKLH